MQREIKYRGEYEGRVYKVTEILWSDDTVYIWDESAGEGMVVPRGTVNLLQFTGIRAMTEREIFEGDIIQSTAGRIGSVGFDSGCFTVEFKDEARDLGAALDDEKYFVIGNIYENPELLK